jgi:hypothetical protein
MAEILAARLPPAQPEAEDRFGASTARRFSIECLRRRTPWRTGMERRMPEVDPQTLRRLERKIDRLTLLVFIQFAIAAFYFIGSAIRTVLIIAAVLLVVAIIVAVIPRWMPGVARALGRRLSALAASLQSYATKAP